MACHSCELVIATSLAMFIGGGTGSSACSLAHVWLHVVGMALGIVYLFESASVEVWFINAATETVVSRDGRDPRRLALNLDPVTFPAIDVRTSVSGHPSDERIHCADERRDRRAPLSSLLKTSPFGLRHLCANGTQNCACRAHSFASFAT